MRLALPTQKSARPRGLLRWIELGSVGAFSGVARFLEKHPTSNIQHPTSSGPKLANPLDVRCSEKKSAFTLIELVIVIVLIGIAAAVIIPEMKGGYQDALLRSTSRELVNVFSIASSRAVSLNQLHRVHIDPGTGRYVIERRTRETVNGDEFKPLDDVSEAEGTLDKRISVRIHNTDDSPDASSTGETSQPRPDVDAISFYSDGTADAAELLLRDRDGYRMALRINPITAHIKILELGRE